MTTELDAVVVLSPETIAAEMFLLILLAFEVAVTSAAVMV